MGLVDFPWLATLWRHRASDRLSSREVSLVRSRTRTLIRIANEVESAHSVASHHGGRPASYCVDQLRVLSVAEEELATSVAQAVSQSLTVLDLDKEVVRPILNSSVIVSSLAREALERAVRAASPDIRTSS